MRIGGEVFVERKAVGLSNERMAKRDAVFARVHPRHARRLPSFVRAYLCVLSETGIKAPKDGWVPVTKYRAARWHLAPRSQRLRALKRAEKLGLIELNVVPRRGTMARLAQDGDQATLHRSHLGRK